MEQIPAWVTIELILAPLFVGGLIWLIRLEAKVMMNERMINLNHQQMSRKLERIEDKLDRLIEARAG